MAVTRLMHMKESPGIPYTHLKNAIEYILDVKHDGAKTEDGLYVGGNAGYDAGDILRTMLGTKTEYDKEHGRQGYHFVISFPPGETDATTAYEAARMFCEEYLGDNYDYVFAVHTDKHHMHAHIIFNSVSRTTGYKYHYVKGDWEKYIQPVTDRVCKTLGLAKLAFEEDRIGVSYASWAERAEGQINWSHIIQSDIDYAISRSHTFAEFKSNMDQMHYTMRFGHSRKRNAGYVTFKFTGEDGKTHSRRSYNLPPGYELADIMDRLNGKKFFEPEYGKVAAAVEQKAAPYLKTESIRLTGTQTFRRMYQAVNYYRLPNPYAVPAGRVRKDMIRIDRLIDECRYLKKNQISTEEGLDKRAKLITEEINALCAERKKLYRVLDGANDKELEMMEQYHRLQLELNAALKEHADRAEETEDAMKELEERLPYDMPQAADRLSYCNRKLKELRKEKRILDDIKETEQESGSATIKPDLAPKK